MRPLFEGWQLKSPFPIARRRRIYLYRRTRGGGTGSTGRTAGHSATYLAGDRRAGSDISMSKAPISISSQSRRGTRIYIDKECTCISLYIIRVLEIPLYGIAIWRDMLRYMKPEEL